MRQPGPRTGITPAWAGSTRGPCRLQPLATDHPRVGGEHVVRAPTSTVAADDPRVGGEHVVAHAVRVVVLGSPPRGRGARAGAGGDADLIGITPAWAGSTGGPYASSRCPRDHPRVGGEHRMNRTAGAIALGSPPRGRGARGDGAALLSRDGITPAWAGSTALAGPTPAVIGDHPRVGGEHIFEGRRRDPRLGSPPRGRGAPGLLGCTHCLLGITPAWAGSTLLADSIDPKPADHPRVGGEHSLKAPAARVPAGSPPRGRGAPVADPRRDTLPGITPAWAGSTQPLRPSRRQRWGAHPRVGGEHCLTYPSALRTPGSPPRGRGGHRESGFRRAGWGSPPRGRGAPYGDNGGGGYRGITPAWAGSTRRAQWTSFELTDHPRVGGEHLGISAYDSQGNGSPPRGRGAP